MSYIDVILDQQGDQADKFYTYKTEDPEIKRGDIVTLPFTRSNQIVTAVVFRVYDQLEAEIPRLKGIEKRTGLTLPEELLDTCLWAAERYIARKNDVLRLMMPPSEGAYVPYLKDDYLKDESDKGVLTFQQQDVLLNILPYIENGEYKSFLLHGVTGSGKTEVYMNLIKETLAKRKTALFLVPEIALTKQIIERFIDFFGEEEIAVIHSRLTKKERNNQWLRILKKEARIVIGARSAVFSPLMDLGIIILDEEHETSYKSDMSPKYETQELALRRAEANQSILLLGSATPSLTTMYEAKTGRHKLLTLTERFNKVPMPEMKSVDMREELREGNKSIISRVLLAEIKKSLDEGKQIILFLNRRGYASFVSCRNCGYIMKCPQCGISLTYHRASDRGVCHYCGYKEKVPGTCPSCDSKYLKYFGVGTEKVEEVCRELFPDLEIARMDLDTVKKRGAMEEILESFHQGETKILIGTQLVAKGLDFDNVNLVGIISADISLNIPDFRSSERTFQLILQAAGRAGRRKDRGKVIVQSYTPETEPIAMALENDYYGFYEKELALRRTLLYPPFSDLIQILITSPEERMAVEATERVEKFIKRKLLAIFGPGEEDNLYNGGPAVIQRKGTVFRYQLVLKSPKDRREAYSEILRETREKFIKEYKKEVSISVDINPYSFL